MNARKFSVADLTVEEEREPVYVNLDAKWLYDHSVELAEAPGISVDDEVLLRLRVIADRHEKLDEKFRNISAKTSSESAEDILVEIMGSAPELQPDMLAPFVARLKAALTPEVYAAGIIEGKRRYLMRSNLPTQAVELSDELRQAIARTPLKPRRVEAPNKAPKPPKVSELSLNGIKLNLTGLK